jgi:predicted adenine nucleotide alpha hydrolase (AANH) superfamily ATPase
LFRCGDTFLTNPFTQCYCGASFALQQSRYSLSEPRILASAAALSR